MPTIYFNRSSWLADENKKVYTRVIEKFDSYFVKQKNVIYERAVFNRRKQEKCRDVYYRIIFTCIEHCEYGNLREKVIPLYQLKESLTLEEDVTQAREAEMIKQQQPLVRGEQKESTASVSAVQKKGGLTTEGPNIQANDEWPSVYQVW